MVCSLKKGALSGENRALCRSQGRIAPIDNMEAAFGRLPPPELWLLVKNLENQGPVEKSIENQILFGNY